MLKWGKSFVDWKIFSTFALDNNKIITIKSKKEL